MQNCSSFRDAAVRENVFVICKNAYGQADHPAHTAGYRDIPVNAHYFDDLINMMKNKPGSLLTGSEDQLLEAGRVKP